MLDYSKKELLCYLSQTLDVSEEKLLDNTRIYPLVKDSLALFDLELGLESKFSHQDINLREKTITVGDLIELLSC